MSATFEAIKSAATPVGGFSDGLSAADGSAAVLSATQITEMTAAMNAEPIITPIAALGLTSGIGLSVGPSTG